MEEIRLQQQIIAEQLYCLENKKGQNLCINSNCEYSAIVCNDNQCKCFNERHKDCHFVPFERLVKRVLNKKQNIPNQLNITLQSIDKMYLQIMDKLSENRYELNLIKENFGLSPDQAHFIQLLKNRQTYEIKGDLINKIQTKINQHHDFTFINKANIEYQLNLLKIKFQSLSKNLKRLYTDKQYFKPVVYNWSKDMLLDGFKINTNRIQKTNNILMLDLGQAYLQPLISFQKKSLFGIRFNKINQNGYVYNIGVMNKELLNRNNFILKNRLQNYPQNKQNFSLGSNGVFADGFGNTKKCFKFHSGDTIYIMYDPLTSELKFCKNVNQGFFKTKVNDEIKSQTLYIYINGFIEGNQAQLTTQIPQINWDQPIYVQNQNQENLITRLPIIPIFPIRTEGMQNYTSQLVLAYRDLRNIALQPFIYAPNNQSNLPNRNNNITRNYNQQNNSRTRQNNS